MTPTPISLSDLRRTFAEPPADARPMMRWWWFGPDVTRADIDRDLDAMQAAGIGGVEVSCVYPLSERPARYLSPAFLADLRYAADQCGTRGLRFDLTLGSGWSFGGPHITAEHAARRLHWDHREIGPGAVEVPCDTGWPDEELVAAYVGAGSLQELPETYDSVPPIAGRLHVPAGAGPRVLLVATARPTGQNVKRAAFGAEGPVHDHYSAAATRLHLDEVARPMVEAVGAERIGSVFCDSLEVYGSDWTPGLLAEFGQRRGYPAEERLWLLVTGHRDAARFRADFYRTLSELYEENFLVPLADWAHERGLRARVQSYGEPPAALSSYRHVDLIEGEQWGWTELPPTKWASSAASHLGVDVVSSETWTWVHAPSFRATPLDLKAEAHEHALLGINQFIGHGWPCRSESVDGIGWFFYASGAFDDRNAWWPAMPSLMRYLQRLSWILRQGAPVRDVLLYLPTGDAYAAFGPSIDLFKVSTGLIAPEVPRVLREGGYDFDLVDDHFLAELEPDGSTIVVVPGEVAASQASRERFDAIRAAGGSVLVAGSLGNGSAGLAAAGEDDRLPEPAGAEVADHLLAALGAVRPPDVQLSPPTADIGVVHRRLGGVDVWFVANTGPHLRRFALATRDVRTVVERWDLHSGTAHRCPGGSERIELALHPYEAVLLVGHDDSSAAAPDSSPAEAASRTPVTHWQLLTVDGTELGPVDLPHRWEDDPRIGPDFSGTLCYVARLDDRGAAGAGAILDFGPGVAADDGPAARAGIEGHSYRVAVDLPVREVVEVLLDGRSVGVVWDAPWRVSLGDAVRPGSTITLRVSNTTVNALAADSTVTHWATEAERLHGRRFRMQALDRALDGISSGLTCAPALVPSVLIASR